MFLHLGGDTIISLKSIISILDMESIQNSKDTSYFLRIAEEEGFIRNIANNKPKSCVITEEAKTKQTIIYYSPISSTTLQKRAKFISSL